ncbi:unnamed protein product [Natator depressus]
MARGKPFAEGRLWDLPMSPTAMQPAAGPAWGAMTSSCEIEKYWLYGCLDGKPHTPPGGRSHPFPGCPEEPQFLQELGKGTVISLSKGFPLAVPIQDENYATDVSQHLGSEVPLKPAVMHRPCPGCLHRAEFHPFRVC